MLKQKYRNNFSEAAVGRSQSWDCDDGEGQPRITHCRGPMVSPDLCCKLQTCEDMGGQAYL
jgi:hypothetical protein